MNDSPLQPQGSVPVAGFSRELRGAADVQRYWFPFALRGGMARPVHVVFSPSQRIAEIKTGDLKAWRVTDVATAAEAREMWIAWWSAGTRRPRFEPPGRTGRHPST